MQYFSVFHACIFKKEVKDMIFRLHREGGSLPLDDNFLICFPDRKNNFKEVLNTGNIVFLGQDEGSMDSRPVCAAAAEKDSDGRFELRLLAVQKDRNAAVLVPELLEHFLEALASKHENGVFCVRKSLLSENTGALLAPVFKGSEAVDVNINWNKTERPDDEFLTRPFIYNDITDVPGVSVGQVTKHTDTHHTGVTVILPCYGNIYDRKPVGASFVLNGFGKTDGTVQVDELGTLETPIALTNTLCVGRAADGLIEYTLREGERCGEKITTINPVVGETNDSGLSQIAERIITTDDVLTAIGRSGKHPELGSVGAGSGTVCFGLKGGIGSASRRISFGKEVFTLGALVQSNFGRLPDLMIHGIPVGTEIEKRQAEIDSSSPEKGSIMVVIGTDLPLTARQLRRVLKRAGSALARLGSYYGHGSGDVFLGFTNGNFHPDQGEKQLQVLRSFPENRMDLVFRPAVEAVEEAILRSLLYAVWKWNKDAGRNSVHCLMEYKDLVPADVMALLK